MSFKQVPFSAWILVGLFVSNSGAVAEDLLKRRVDSGMRFGEFKEKEGLPVSRVEAGSAAERLGLKPGDVLAGLNGKAFTGGLDADARLFALRAGAPVTLDVSRAGVRQAFRADFPPLTKDEASGVEFSYEQVKNPLSGLMQRVIISRPKGAIGRLPAVFFIPWLSCDSVEVPKGTRGGIETLLYRIAAESGAVLMRVEKPGVGDSEGICNETDFDTEMAGNRAAFAAVRRHPWVDGLRVIAMGQSFSGGLLPLVAPNADTAGYLFINSWSRTWLERLLEFERRRLEMSELTAGVVSERMRALAEIYGLVLEGGMTPGDVIRRKPVLAAAWEDAPDHQYGRPIRFMQQLQAANVSGPWQRVDKPTLVVFGEADIVMSRLDHDRVVDFVNKNRPGAARLIAVPGMDHGMAAPLADGASGLPPALGDSIVSWIRSVLGI